MLSDVVSSISVEVGASYPVYVDDTCVYVCGASDMDLRKLSSRTRGMASELGYTITTIPMNKIRKLGLKSYRMR